MFRLSVIMAVPAGRSVVFVTGNAKKLEEVRIKHVVSEADCMHTMVLLCLNRFKQDICAAVSTYWSCRGSEHDL